MEEWRDIKGFEGKYMVSNLGRVKSLNYHRTGKEKIMKGNANGDGYLYVTLSKDGKVKTCRINRLVAQAFLENPNNLPEVNHKDENKYNNCVENLEYCSRSYNVNYGTGIKRSAEKHRKPVYSIDKESGLITYWESIREAGKVLGIDSSHITACCKGKLKSAGGFYWHYSESEEVM